MVLDMVVFGCNCLTSRLDLMVAETKNRSRLDLMVGEIVG